MKAKNLITQPPIAQINERLRGIRLAAHLTLLDVERLSSGAIGSVALGSYERGTRALSLKKIIELANFYQVPVEDLITGKKPVQASTEARSTIDFQKTRDRAHTDIDIATLSQFLTGIAHLRGDWNGQVMSIRESDMRVIALVCRREIGDVRQWLAIEGLLLK
jgi:transcriptional regulator with XRE-family HTH domain